MLERDRGYVAQFICMDAVEHLSFCKAVLSNSLCSRCISEESICVHYYCIEDSIQAS